MNFHTMDNFRLQSGGVLPQVTIAYRTLGRLAASRDNAVLITHGYTSGPNMIAPADESIRLVAEGGWSQLVGPGKPINTERFFVLCTNMLGSSYGSTNASIIDPATGKPYGPHFPRLTVADIVACQHRLLMELGITRLVAVAGPSYGGFQAFQWAVNFPGFVDGIIAVVSAPKSPGNNARSLQAQLEQDPNWNGGDYYSSGGVHDTMVELRVAMLKKYGIETVLQELIPGVAFRDAMICDLATRWAAQFDAHSLLILGKALEGFDTEPYFDRIRARVLYVLSRTDQLFPPSLALEVMEKLRRAGVDADYFEIDSPYGHLASGLDAAKWAGRLRSFMASLP